METTCMICNATYDNEHTGYKFFCSTYCMNKKAEMCYEVEQ